MEIKNGVVTKIYDSDCAYNEAIIPDRTTIIGQYCANNIIANKIQLPNSVIKVSDYAFLDCTNLEEINIPSSVTYIGERAFFNCKNLKKITLPDNIEYIGPSAFSGCENLKEIYLPRISDARLYKTIDFTQRQTTVTDVVKTLVTGRCHYFIITHKSLTYNIIILT